MRSTTAVAALCSLFLASGAAQARPEVTILKEKVKGDQAFANFAQDTPIDCGEGFIGSKHVSVFAMGNDFVQRGDFNQEKLHQIEISVIVRDSCTGQQLVGREVLTDPDFQIKQTRKAHIGGAAFLSDLFSGEPIGFVQFDIDFMGVGTVSRSKSHSNVKDGDIRTIQHSEGAIRDATVSGTLTIDDGVNPVNEMIDDFVNAEITKVKSGFIQITRE